MDLDEAIKYFEEMVEIGETYEINKGMLEENRQLAEWLKELKAYKEQGGDAISREELIEALDTWDKFGYAPTNELIPLRGNVDKDKYVPYIHYDDVIECIKGMPSVTKQPCGDAVSRQAVLDIITFEDKWLFDANGHNANTHIAFSGLESRVKALPSVSPQQRTGRWIPTGYDGYADGNPVYDWWECSECGWEHTGDEESLTAFCPDCGAKMEVEE